MAQPTSRLDWRKLYFGPVCREEVQRAIKDPAWQALRRAIKGKSLQEKYDRLENYLKRMFTECVLCDRSDEWWRDVEVRLTNYVTALSRGGLIKPEDYR